MQPGRGTHQVSSSLLTFKSPVIIFQFPVSGLEPPEPSKASFHLRLKPLYEGGAHAREEATREARAKRVLDHIVVDEMY